MNAPTNRKDGRGLQSLAEGLGYEADVWHRWSVEMKHAVTGAKVVVPWPSGSVEMTPALWHRSVRALQKGSRA